MQFSFSTAYSAASSKLVSLFSPQQCQSLLSRGSTLSPVACPDISTQVISLSARHPVRESNSPFQKVSCHILPRSFYSEVTRSYRFGIPSLLYPGILKLNQRRNLERHAASAQGATMSSAVQPSCSQPLPGFADGTQRVPASYVDAALLKDAEGLARWLNDRMSGGEVDTASWGALAGSKPMANLWSELKEGEITLQDSIPPIRKVNVASVRIKDSRERVLWESHQEMADGRVRTRDRLLSEKLKPGESVEDACLRGIEEELGSQLGARERVLLYPQSYTVEVQDRMSFSYPGLLSRYVVHTMAATIKGLPEEDFSTDEDEHGSAVTHSSHSKTEAQAYDVEPGKKAVGVRRHFWVWKA